jgi:hypothetical protein
MQAAAGRRMMGMPSGEHVFHLNQARWKVARIKRGADKLASHFSMDPQRALALVKDAWLFDAASLGGMPPVNRQFVLRGAFVQALIVAYFCTVSLNNL